MTVAEKKPLDITKLYQKPDGNYAVSVDGKELGLINAQTRAQFVLNGGRVLEAGEHTVEFAGRKLTVVVKDITPGTTFYDLNRIEPEYREECRISKTRFYEPELKQRLAHAKKHNEDTMAEILGRVVVSEA